MPTAILISFQYDRSSDSEIVPLVGAVIDLYHAYTWATSFSCQTHLLTDFDTIKDTEVLHRAVERKFATSNLLTFFDPENITVIHRASKLLTTISKILPTISDQKLILYYSGHGKNDGMVLPDRTILSFVKLRDHILSILQQSFPRMEIFWILDCCNPHGIHLPYKLSESTRQFQINPDLNRSTALWTPYPILLLTSSDPNEKSIATRLGSIFTRHFFLLLNQLTLPASGRFVPGPEVPTRNLFSLVAKLKSRINASFASPAPSSSKRFLVPPYHQTVSIYGSYKMDPILWMWIGSNRRYDIVSDLSRKILVLRLHSETTAPKHSKTK